MGRLRVAIDGGSRGNPGPAAWGVAILDDAGACIDESHGVLGRATNNVAEYHALLAALEIAAARGARELDVQADSELLVRQIRGDYRVRHPDLQPLWAEALRRIRALDGFSIRHVRREQNRDADRLVNRALDEAEAQAGAASGIEDRP